MLWLITVNNQTKDTQGFAPLRKRNGSGNAKSELEKASEVNGQCTDVLVDTDQEKSTETDTNASNIATQCRSTILERSVIIFTN